MYIQHKTDFEEIRMYENVLEIKRNNSTIFCLIPPEILRDLESFLIRIAYEIRLSHQTDDDIIEVVSEE